MAAVPTDETEDEDEDADDSKYDAELASGSQYDDLMTEILSTSIGLSFVTSQLVTELFKS